MRRLLFLFLLLSCVVMCARELTGLVVKVADGDTLTLVDARGEQHRVRLWGIDSPEKAQPNGRKAGAALSALVLRRNVRVEVNDTDQYGRKVGRVFLGAQDINLEMVRKGLAWHYVQYAKGASDLAEAERAARQGGLGLWADPNPQAPWDYRRGQRVRRGK